MKQGIIALLVLLLVGGIVLLVLGKSSEAPTMEDGEMSETTQDSEAGMSEDMETNDRGSLAEMFALGENVRCEYKTTVEGDVSEGTFYTDGERFRTESTYTSPEETITSSVVNDGEYIYTWGDTPSGTMAIKMPVMEEGVSETQPPAPDDAQSNAYVNMDQQVEYDCDNWSVDASLFVPPSDVTFTDMGNMMQGMQQNMPEGFEMPEGY